MTDLESLEARVTLLEQRASTENRLNARSDETLQRVLDTQERHTATLYQHTTILGRLETDVADLRTRMGKLETDVAGLKTDVAGHTAALDRIEQMLVALLERGIEK